MNFAKKTMSLALASVMAASSLFVGSTAFAATDKVIKPMTGNTQAVTATVKDTINKYGYHDYDVDSSVYAYTPAKTGYYAVSVKSTLSMKRKQLKPTRKTALPTPTKIMNTAIQILLNSAKELTMQA